ncbi:ferredoxin Fer [Haloferax sp. ATCC BAA-646]|uniref:ferredoxin Fer n=1 Tax=Haloferax TaxID=2251 RepID=UPI0002B0D653|nr:ferredoxin Fer [Haloferax sp. ATCC BAA-646]ELZ57102.1 Ferredoxin 2 [Haloferax sp. ATCC BAA-646]
MDSPFETLGIDPDADEDELVDAYRRRVKSAHPDHGGSAEEFQAVRTAYEAIRGGYEPGDELEPVDTDGRRPTDEGATRNGQHDADAARNGHAGSGAETGGEGAGGDADPEPEPERRGARVEFLDYDVVTERGWSLTDDDLFEKAAESGLDGDAYGEVFVEPRTNLLKAAEDAGHSWPFACRGGACANCAVAVVAGEVKMPSNHILSEEMLDQGVRLSCISLPVTDDLQVVYNIEHLPGLDELRLPPQHARKMSTGR